MDGVNCLEKKPDDSNDGDNFAQHHFEAG